MSMDALAMGPGPVPQAKDPQESESTVPPSSCKTRCLKYLPHMTFCTGCTCLVVMVVAFILTDSMLHEVVNGQAVISTSMKFYDEWKNHGDDTADIKMHYHLYNVSNVEEIMTGTDVKPVLTPVGPFVYTQRLYKDNITFSQDGNEVRYTYTQKFIFDAEASAHAEDTPIVMPNLAVMAAVWRSANAGLYCNSKTVRCKDSELVQSTPTALNTLGFQAAQPSFREFISHTAKEWLWGFKDPVVTAIQGIAGPNGMGMPIKVQDWISLQFNDSADMWNHTTAQYTGKDHHLKGGKIFQWEGCAAIGSPSDPNSCANRSGNGHAGTAQNGENYGFDGSVAPNMEFFGGPSPAQCAQYEWADCPAFGCRFDTDAWKCVVDHSVDSQGAEMVDGSDAYQMHPQLEDDEEPAIFLDQTFRKFKLQHTGKQTWQGVDCGKWTFHENTFRSAEHVPSNAAYLQDVDGLLNLTRAQAAPIFLSKPLFEGTKALQDLVEIDESANELKRPSWFLFEPWTGMGLAADINIQINMKVFDMADFWNQRFMSKLQGPTGTLDAMCGGCLHHPNDPDQCQCLKTTPNVTYTKQDGSSITKPFTQGLKTAYYPMVNIHQSVAMKDAKVSKLKSKALTLIRMGRGLHSIGAYVLLAFGIVQIIGAFVCCGLRRQRTKHSPDCNYTHAEKQGFEYTDKLLPPGHGDSTA